MVKVKKAALGAFGMASLQAFGVGVGDDAATVPQQVSNQKLDMVLSIIVCYEFVINFPYL